MAWSSDLSVESPESGLGPFLKREGHPPRIEGLIVDIEAYNIASYRTVAAASPPRKPVEESDGHERVLTMPKARGGSGPPLEHFRYHVYFDGG